MLLPPDLAEFVAGFVEFQRRIADAVERGTSCVSRLDRSSRLPDDEGRLELGAAEVEWQRWLDASVHPELDRLRDAVHDALARIEREHPILAFELELRAAIGALPDTVLLQPGSAGASERGAAAQVETPLRRWFELELLPAIEPAFTELEQVLFEGLQDLAGRIQEVERVLAYYTLAVQRHAAEFEASQAEELAHTGLERVQRLLEELHQRHAGEARRALAGFLAEVGDALDDALAPYRAHRPELILRGLAEHERASARPPREPGPLRRAITRVEHLGRVALPLARRFGSELRTLFDEREPEPDGAATRSLLAAEPSALGAELPLSYRRLFAIAPIQIADLYVRRPQLEQICAATVDAWLRGIPQAILVHGDRGSGKRTLVNHVLAYFRGRMPLDARWIRLGPKLREQPAVARVLGQTLGLGATASEFAELSRAPAGQQRVIVVENTERLLAPSPAGVARMHEFLAMVRSTAESTLWVLLMATPASALALDRLGLGNRVATVLHVEPMTSAELHAMIEARHRLSGFELEFVTTHARLLERLIHPLTSFRERAPIEGFFVRLARLTGGNPRQALYYWLASARPCPQRSGCVLVEPLPSVTLELLASRTLSQRLILALLAQHGSLAADELGAALAEPSESVAGDIDVLWTIGYLAPSRELAGHWTLHPLIAHPLLLELRANNLA